MHAVLNCMPALCLTVRGWYIVHTKFWAAMLAACMDAKHECYGHVYWAMPHVQGARP